MGNDGSIGFQAGVLISVIISFITFLNLDATTYPEYFYASESLCVNNSGLKYYKFGISSFEIVCNDGAVFSNDKAEIMEIANKIKEK